MSPFGVQSRGVQRRDGLGSGHDAGELPIEICQRHGVDIGGGMCIAIRPDAIEGPGRVAHQASIESEIAGHAGRRLDAMICCRATDYERLDIGGTQLLFQVGADEGAVHSFDDNGLAFDLARFILDRIAGAVRKERRARAGTFMADVKDRHAAASKRREQFNDARKRLGIVPPFASGLPFIERALHVDDNQGSTRWRLADSANSRVNRCMQPAMMA